MTDQLRASGGRPASGPPSPRPSPTSADFRRPRRSTPLLAGAGDPVGLATVYRTLQALAADGEVDMLRTEDGEAIYRRCSTRTTTTTSCAASCGLRRSRSRAAVERWTEAIAAEHGFTDVRHTLEIFGTVRRTARPPAAEAHKAAAVQKAETDPGARCGRLSARSTAAWPCRSAATDARRASTASAASSGNAGVSTPTLAARSSECASTSIARVSTKSALDSDQPCHGISTVSGSRSPARSGASVGRQGRERSAATRSLQVGRPGCGVLVGGGAHADVRLVCPARCVPGRPGGSARAP